MPQKNIEKEIKDGKKRFIIEQIENNFKKSLKINI